MQVPLAGEHAIDTPPPSLVGPLATLEKLQQIVCGKPDPWLWKQAICWWSLWCSSDLVSLPSFPGILTCKCS